MITGQSLSTKMRKENDCCYPKNSQDNEEKSDKRGIYNSAFTVENKAEEIIKSFKDFLEKQ